MVYSSLDKKLLLSGLNLWLLTIICISNDTTKIKQQFNARGKYSETTLIEQIDQSKIDLVTYSKSKDKQKEVITCKNIGRSYQLLDQFDSAIHYYQKGAEIAQSNHMDELYSSIVYNLGLACSSIGQYHQALQYALKGLETDKKLNNIENISASQNGIAIIYQRWGKYDKALEHQLISLKLSEESGNHKEIANGYYNLGTIYFKLKKTEQALKYFNLAKANFNELIQNDTANLELKQGLSETLYSIAGVFVNSGKLNNALQTYDSALYIKTLTLDKVGIANIYNQIGTIFVLQENYPLSIINFMKSLQYKQSINDKKGIAIAYYNIAKVYLKQGNIEKSEKYFRQSIETALIINDKEVLKEVYLMLSEIYEQKKKPAIALKYHKLFTTYSDSVMDENTTKIIEELSVQYETERIQKDNKIKALTIKKQKTLAFLLTGIIALAIIITIVLFTLYNSKKKSNEIISNKNILLKEQNVQIASQNKIIESKNRDLTDSIHYGKRIQESMLTNISELNKTLPDAFILLKPKDIVSGDFYWFGQQNGKFILSAIDCTGHGVPGAFMSLLGNSFLENIIYKEGETSPDKILNELNNSVQKSLKQAETNNQDGMDMAICSIDHKAKLVEFSGAKNPLIYIQNNELFTIKGDKYPIGRSLYESVSFCKHQIRCDVPTSFYMFSDGYIDQFGGPDNGKFKPRRLRDLILNIHTKPMSEQKGILDETIENWRNGQEQIDDILIVGFKLG